MTKYTFRYRNETREHYKLKQRFRTETSPQNNNSFGWKALAYISASVCVCLAHQAFFVSFTLTMTLKQFVNA